MKPVYKFFVPVFVLALLAVSAIGVAFARNTSEASGGAGEIEIVGVVEEITDDAWTIDGKVYQLTPATEIKGMIQPGAQVKVHLYTGANGALTAREIELAAPGATSDDFSDDQSTGNTDDNSGDDNPGDDENEISGTVEDITQTAWKIDGKVYRITAATEIKGTIQPGAQVKVHAYLDENGVLTIREVELANADDSASGGTGDDSSDDDNSGDDSSGDDYSDDDSSGDDSSDDDYSDSDDSGDDSSDDNSSGDDSDDSSSNGDDDNSDDNSNDDDDHDDDDDDDDDDNDDQDDDDDSDDDEDDDYDDDDDDD